MRILLSNDDGIHAPGIQRLYDALASLAHVDVVAPAAQQSAVGHAITIADPIKCRPVYRADRFFGHAVGGTPADCVKLAVCSLLKHRPDLVVSGINLGPNAGISAIYSGTVSAATEGTILGIPSMAVSLDTFTEPHWETAARAACRIVPLLYRHGLPESTLLNLNVPNVAPNRLKGFRVARMARSRFRETFDRRTDPRGNEYFWMDGEMEVLDDSCGSDLEALADGYASLTPISIDLTAMEALPYLADWIDEISGG